LYWLTHFEQGPNGGFAAVPYRDSAGHRTVGWGHKIRKNEAFDTPLTEADALDLLRRDLRDPCAYVAALDTYLSQCQFDALVMFAFNLGIGALERSTLLAVIRADARPAEKRAAIEKQWMRWVYVRNPLARESDGLKRRRVVELLLFLGVGDEAITRENDRLMAVARVGNIGPKHVEDALRAAL
jgi:GH24 family phage-related lysozyme (muramidase)